MPQPLVTRVGDRVVRLGSALLNWYLVVADDRVVVVDTALPGYLPQLDLGLRELGRSRDDVAAIVLTHAHFDHAGGAELLRAQLGVPVYVHADEAELALTAQAPAGTESSMLPYLRYAQTYRFWWERVRNDGRRTRPIAEVQTFGDGDELPGGIRAIHTPGHREGHCCLLAGDVVLTGDALITFNMLTGERGAQVAPRVFNRSTPEALRSLDRIAASSASVVASGHGEPVVGVEAAVEQAKRRGPT